MLDPAYMLFPSDAPAGVQTILSGKDTAPAVDQSANLVFPNDAPAAPQRDTPGAGHTAQKPADADIAGKLFPSEADRFDDAPINSFFDGFSLSALSDGDSERAGELQSARDAFIADAKKAGADARELSAALDIVKENQGNNFGSIDPDKAEAAFAESTSLMRQELGDTFDADIGIARAFILDLEKIAPGTIASLERTGAGNDPRLIRSAIREAKRRGYK